MLLQADEMVYDNENNRVTAKGNVEIYYGNYTLLADQVIYDRNYNTLTAKGNVRIKDPEGAVITSNHMTLTDDFRDGFIDALRLVTKDDTRIVAETASREAGNVTVFKNGWFTPCKPCEDNPEKPPTWRIRATKIIHRKDEATITYRNAFFDFFGVPVLYVPYFQSADPTVKRKSGFLMPTYGNYSQLGNTVTVPYYFALSDHYDFTFAPTYTEKAGALLQGQWRHRLASGGYNINLAGVFNPQGDPATPGRRGLPRQHGLHRANLHLTPIMPWAGISRRHRRYVPPLLQSRQQVQNGSRLASLSGGPARPELFQHAALQHGWSGTLRHARIRSVGAPSHRLRLHRQPTHHRRRAQLQFQPDEPNEPRRADSTRLTTEVNWRRQMIDGIGQVYTPFAQLRGDVYDVNNFTDPRTICHRMARRRLAMPSPASTIVIRSSPRPAASRMSWSRSARSSRGPIPSAISRKFRTRTPTASSSTIRSCSISTSSRATTVSRPAHAPMSARSIPRSSIRAPMPAPCSARATSSPGQNEFALSAPGSGLDTDRSDYVSGLYIQATTTSPSQGRHASIRLPGRSGAPILAPRRKYGPVAIAMDYADVKDAPGLGQGNTQQEIYTIGSLALTDTWSLLGNVRFDLEMSRWVQDGVGLRYQNDCFTLGVTYLETNVKDLDIQPDKTFMVNFSLKDLGSYSFKTDAFGLAGDLPY